APQSGPGRVIARLADLLLTRSFRDADASPPLMPAERVAVIGDPLVDLVQRHARAALAAAAWRRYGVAPGSYILAVLSDRPTPEATARLSELASTVPLLLDASEEYVVPGAHRVSEITFLEQLSLERAARAIFTDSELVRAEAAQFGVRCHNLENAADRLPEAPRATPAPPSWERAASA